MIPTTCKRLIEVDFPIAKVSEHSAREKSIRYGHPSTLHLWWARRPLAACRGVLMGLLLPDPCDPECPNEFKVKARQLLAKRSSKPSVKDDDLRQLLLDFIGEFADWDHAANATYLEIGRGLVKAAHPEEPPVVVDPFSGGGSIPLEALRLGCEAFASDLNPVACLILKTLLEDIPRYSNADFKLPGKNGEEQVLHGLADALRHVAGLVKEAAEKRLAQFYPPDPDGSRPIAYLWARTVRCEGIGCGAEIPLVRSFWLSKKAGRRRAFRYRVNRPRGKPPEIDFEIFAPKSEQEVPHGTVNRADATCPCCHTVLPAERVCSQVAAQLGGANTEFAKGGERTGGAMLLAVVILQKGTAGRQFRLPTDRDYSSILAARRRVAQLPKGKAPDEPLPPVGTLGFRVQRYGMLKWGDLFSDRQIVAQLTLAEALDGLSIPDVLKSLCSIGLSRRADIANALCPWSVSADQVVHLFGRHAIPMLWDYAESCPFGEQAGDLTTSVDSMARVIEALQVISMHGTVQQADATASVLPDKSISLWVTDPPYYDAIPYSDLSDFFFTWLKRTNPDKALLRDVFDATNVLTPKEREIVQDDTKRYEGRVKDRTFFESRMALAFKAGQRVLRDDGIGCVVFAHKSTEGWEALLSGLISGGWSVTASWPISTEKPGRLRAQQSAALASSVHLVCRPRPAHAGVGDWGDVKVTMEKRIREWLPSLTKHGVRGADAIFSCLGPALESYSRYDRVLTAADREVPLGGDPDATEPHERGFLAYVFEALSKEALRQVLGDAETEGFEEDARMTALFLWTLQATKVNGNGATKNGTEAEDNEPAEEGDSDKPKKAKPGLTMPFDTFIRITRPMGIHYAALENRIIDMDKGIVRLLPVSERSEQLLGEAAKRPGIEISLEEVKQLELGLVTKRREDAVLANVPKRGKKTPATPDKAAPEVEFTTIDRLHRAMLLFSLGRGTVLRQVLEKEMNQSQRFERLALALNALYPDGSDERRMLEGVQSAMRGIR